MSEEDDARMAKVLERLRARHQAYLEVFGPPERPTTAGAIVLADMEKFARFGYTSVHRPRVGDTPGPLDPYGTIYNLALKEFVQRIHLQLAWSEEDGDSSDRFDGE